jgi:alkanesulfonate monooxygenase SsuD/methylene tetrahydromethanopterin reductase-like flavin-dependent oxidoreductase (luciferase family)
MKFGVVAGPVFPPYGDMPSDKAFKAMMAMCEVARDSGFDGISVPHHYLTGPDAQVFPPIVVLGYIAAICPDMYLATTVMLLPLEQPVAMAEQAATLDAMTGGKFIFGIGQGYRAQEFESLGIARKEKAPRIVEECEILRRLWTGKTISFEGKYYKLNNATCSVKPIRPGGPPLMVGADKLVSIARIPEHADYWVPSARQSRPFLREMVPAYKQSLEKAGRKFDGLPFTRDICVGKDRDEAIATAREAFERQYSIQRKWQQPGEDYNVGFDELMHDRLIVGTPKEAAEELIRDHEEFGCDFVWFRLYWPGMDRQKCLNVIERIGQEVLPIVRDRVGGKSLFDVPASEPAGRRA